MKKAVFTTVALIVAAMSIAVAAASADNVRYGVNDDEGMFEKGSGPFLPTLTGLGMHDNTVTVRWDDTTASGFADLGGGVTLQSFLPSYAAAANLAGVTLTFDVYPLHSAAAGDPATNAPKFAAWLKTLAQAYPSVTHYVVMNECNQPLFVNPQYDANGNLLSAAACGQFLAQGYQALKSVNSNIFVWGLGLSPHGAKVDGKLHRDSDPFSFLNALGQWYRSSAFSGQRIMDGLDLHPYPIPQSVPFAQGNSNAYGPAYGVATLPLVYQAFDSAFGFAGSGQPTVGSSGHLPVSLNEVGYQTIVPAGTSGYTGTETPNWGVDTTNGTPDKQAAYYKQLVDTTECDADITNVNIFKLVDQSDLSAWQSGLYYLGWLPKESASVVRQEIANVKACPAGAASYFTPTGSGATSGSGSGSASGGSAIGVSGDLTTVSGADAGDLAQILSAPARNVSVPTELGTISNGLGVATSSGTGSVQWLATAFTKTAGRRLADARTVGRTFSFTKGKKIAFPRLSTPKAGTYRLRIVLHPTGGHPVTLTTAVVGVNAKGKIVAPSAVSKKPKKKTKK